MAVTGKVLRRSFEDASERSPTHLQPAFAALRDGLPNPHRLNGAGGRGLAVLAAVLAGLAGVSDGMPC